MSYENNPNTSSHRETVLHREIDVELKSIVEWWEKYYASRNPERAKEIREEFAKLKEAFEEAKKSNWKITKKELEALENDIKKVNHVINENAKESKKLEKKVLWKDIEKYKDNKEATILALHYLNNNYKDRTDADYLDKVKSLFWENETIKKLNNKRDIRLFQEKLLHNLWINEEWYTKTQLLWAYSKDYWNYCTNVHMIEGKIKDLNLKKIGNKALTSYLNYLEWTWKLNKKYLIEHFWLSKTRELLSFYQRNNEKDESDFTLNISDKIKNNLNIVYKSLEDVKDIVVEKASEALESLENFINWLSNVKSSQELSDKLKNIDKYKDSEKEKLIEIVKSKRENYKKLFLDAMKNSWLKERAKDKIVEDFMKKLDSHLTVKDLGTYINLVKEFNSRNKVDLKVNKLINAWTEYKKANAELNTFNAKDDISLLNKQIAKAKVDKDFTRLKFLEKKKNWLEKSLLNANKTISEVKSLTYAMKAFSEKWLDLDKIKSAKEYEQALGLIRESDKEFDAELKKEEAIQKKFDLEIKKYEQEALPEAGKKDKSEKVNKESEKNNNTQKEIYEGKTFNVIKNESWDTTAYTGIIWTKQISILASELTWKEKEDLENNPEKIKNFVEFKLFLEETGLGFLWKYRDKLKNKLAEKNNFYDYEDWLSTKEQLDLLNFIGEKLWFTKTEDLAYLKEKFEQKSKLSVFEVNVKKYENNSDKNIFEQALEWKLIDKWKWIE